MVHKDKNEFCLVDASCDGISIITEWCGFEKNSEIRIPRYMPLNECLKLRRIGYDFIIRNEFDLLLWYKRGFGKAVIHKSIMEKYLLRHTKPSEYIHLANGGIIGKETSIGKKLSRKSLNKKERNGIKIKFKNTCVPCGSLDDITIHHILERRFGGGTEIKNTVPLCCACHTNLNKGDIDRFVFFKYRGLN